MSIPLSDCRYCIYCIFLLYFISINWRTLHFIETKSVNFSGFSDKNDKVLQFTITNYLQYNVCIHLFHFDIIINSFQ